MPDREYISKQMLIANNHKYPEAIRKDALFRAISNSNLNGLEYPSHDNISSEKIKVYAGLCQAFVDGHIDLNAIQEQASEILFNQLLRE